MASKTAPAVSNTPAPFNPDGVSRDFREGAHRGHIFTHVGSFSDGAPGNPPYDVWYCRNDHTLLIA